MAVRQHDLASSGQKELIDRSVETEQKERVVCAVCRETFGYLYPQPRDSCSLGGKDRRPERPNAVVPALGFLPPRRLTKCYMVA